MTLREILLTPSKSQDLMIYREYFDSESSNF